MGRQPLTQTTCAPLGPNTKYADLWTQIWELIGECAEIDWDLDVEYVKANRTAQKKKKAITKEQLFGMEGNEKQMSWLWKELVRVFGK